MTLRAWLSFSALALSLCSPTLSYAQKRKAVVHLTHFTDDLHAAKMALSFANEFQRQGASTVLVLSLEGVRLADRGQPINMLWGPSGISMGKGGPSQLPETLESLWTKYVTAGGTVLACPGCSASVGCELKDLRDGANIGSMEKIAQTLLEADVLLSY